MLSLLIQGVFSCHSRILIELLELKAEHTVQSTGHVTTESSPWTAPVSACPALAHCLEDLSLSVRKICSRLCSWLGIYTSAADTVTFLSLFWDTTLHSRTLGLGCGIVIVLQLYCVHHIK